MDIPAVVGAREASRLIRQDDWLVIDGDAGTVIVDPPASVIAEYRALKRSRDASRAGLARLRHLPAVTLDGEAVELLANIEQPGDAAAALEAGAAGIGLFRSEFLFMNRDGDLPGEDEQFEAYRTAVEAMRGLPVTIRTVDVGADKALDRMSANELRHEHALNPALGLRAIRWSLSEPAMFRQQLRAILRAAAHGKVRMLLPMVAHLSEVRQTLDALARARQQLDDAGRSYGPVEIGAMVEVPAAALMLPAFLRHFDFVSIGTNDLIQYTLAIDRADEAVAHLYNPWHPAVLQLVAQTIAGARAVGKERQRLRRDGRRHRLQRAAAGDGPAQLLDASVADRRRQGAHPRDRCGALVARRCRASSRPTIRSANASLRRARIAQERAPASQGDPARSAAVSATAL